MKERCPSKQSKRIHDCSTIAKRHSFREPLKTKTAHGNLMLTFHCLASLAQHFHGLPCSNSEDCRNIPASCVNGHCDTSRFQWAMEAKKCFTKAVCSVMEKPTIHSLFFSCGSCCGKNALNDKRPTAGDCVLIE